MKWFVYALILINSSLYASQNKEVQNKEVMIAILARNKEHVLQKFLTCIENQDYPKNLITIYINTNNNVDTTEGILLDWMAEHQDQYKNIIYEEHFVSELSNSNPHDWNPNRFKALAEVRNKSLRVAKELGVDYYFVVDCDNFIAPFTLSYLLNKKLPIVSPLLRCIPEKNDYYSNFFYKATPTGYYKDSSIHIDILLRKMLGTFKVDLVHCLYLIDSKHLDKLNYIDGTDDYEFIIFSRYARKNKVDQYICNEKEFGVQFHFYENLSLEEEKNRVLPFLTIP